MNETLTTDSKFEDNREMSSVHEDLPDKSDYEGQVEDEHVEDINQGFSTEEQRQIIRRIDRRLIITVGCLYCVNFMDRTNMSFANIAGMSTELKLTGNKYVGHAHFTNLISQAY